LFLRATVVCTEAAQPMRQQHQDAASCMRQMVTAALRVGIFPGQRSERMSKHGVVQTPMVEPASPVERGILLSAETEDVCDLGDGIGGDQAERCLTGIVLDSRFYCVVQSLTSSVLKL